MLNSERTLPSVTCMLLMLGTIKTACQSFSVITPTSLTQSEHYAAVEELVKQLCCDSSRIWDSMKFWMGKCCSPRLACAIFTRWIIISLFCLTKNLLFKWNLPSLSAVVLFRSKASAALRIVDDADDDCSLQAMCTGKKIRSECFTQKLDTSTYATRISLDAQQNAVNLYWHSWQKYPETAIHFASSNDRSYCSQHFLRSSYQLASAMVNNRELYWSASHW